MEFLPPEAHVAVRRVASPQASEDPETPVEGVVVAVGPGAEFRPATVKVGERVYFNRGSGFEIGVGGVALLLMEEAALLRLHGLICAADTV